MSASASARSSRRDRRRRQALRRERRRRALGAVGVPPPHQHALDVAHRAMRLGHERRERAGPDDDERARVRARQVGRRQRGRRGRAPQRQRLAVDQRDRVAGRAVHQHVERADARDPALVVAREHRDDLDAEPRRRPTPASAAGGRLPASPRGSTRTGAVAPATNAARSASTSGRHASAACTSAAGIIGIGVCKIARL